MNDTDQPICSKPESQAVELEGWLSDVAESVQGVRGAFSHRSSCDRTAAHLVSRATFAMSFAQRCVDDVAKYLNGTLLAGLKPEEAVVRVAASTDAIRAARPGLAIKVD